MSMPSVPVSIFIDKEIKIIENKVIKDVKCELIYEGRYSWHGASFDNLHEVVGSRIIFADAHYIYTDNSKAIDIGYFHGDLRFYTDIADIQRSKLKKPVTHGYMVTFLFDDASCLVLTLYSWSTHFAIKEFDKNTSRLKQTAIDASDENDFTLERFKDFYAGREKENIIENCSTAHGAFDIDNPVMSYILLISGIHPRTKTNKLSDAEIAALYANTKTLIVDYKTGKRICEYNSIFGGKIEAKNDILKMNSNILGKPCPICGTPIDSVPCAGTKMYFCPKCQVIKK